MASTTQETSRPGTAAQPTGSVTQTERDAAPDAVVVGAGFAGLYMLHKLRTLGFRAGVHRGRRRRGRHLVLEPLPRRALRHHHRRLHLQLRPRAGSRHGPGRRSTPPSPRSCATPSSWPNATTCGATSDFGTRVRPGALGRSREPLADPHQSRARRSRRRFYIMATGCLSVPKDARHPRRRQLSRARSTSPAAGRTSGVDFTGKRVAVIGTGSSGDPVDPAHRRSRPQQLTVFQRTAELLDAGPQRPGRTPSGSQQLAGRPRRLPARRRSWSRAGVPMPLNTVYGRYAPPEVRAQRLRGRLGVRRTDRGHRHRSPTRACSRTRTQLVRRDSSATRSAPIVNDPASRRSAVPEGPPLRHQAAVPGHRTTTRPSTGRNVRLVDLQAHADRDDHRAPASTSATRSLRLRRDRLRHRLRRDDRRHWWRSTSPGATA